MIDGQLNIFDVLYPKFKIDKPIKLIELFGGYGSQALALKYLGVNFEHHILVEWAIKSIQAYKDIHFTNDNTDYSKDLTTDEIKTYLYMKQISSNYNQPMTKTQIDRLDEKQARNIYNNIKITNNLVNIQQVNGEDLCIKDVDKFTYLLTYSFPCQDLSQIGRGKGMSDTSTRSGMLWEVERILTECKELPQVLLMENVIQVHGEDNLNDFNRWKYKLEELGYKNYFKDLIATDYEIPQTRNRCFMVSILGDYNYTFPKTKQLKTKLSGLLEKEVNDKYLIKEGTIKCFLTQKENGFPRRERFLHSLSLTNDKDLAGTLTASQGGVATDNHILINKIPKKKNLQAKDFKIRNLTPKECFRLMGVKDEDYEKCAKNQSDNSLYHLAGDSIVVNVLMAIFKEML